MIFALLIPVLKVFVKLNQLYAMIIMLVQTILVPTDNVSLFLLIVMMITYVLLTPALMETARVQMLIVMMAMLAL
jgi:hypothetical protein